MRLPKLGDIGCGRIGIVHEELDVARGDLHVECAGDFSAGHGVRKRSGQIIGIIRLVEDKVRPVIGHHGVIAERQIDGRHRAFFPLLGRQVVLGGPGPGRTVPAQFEIGGSGLSGEEDENHVAGLPTCLYGLGPCGRMPGVQAEGHRSGRIPGIFDGLLLTGNHQCGKRAEQQEYFFHFLILPYYPLDRFSSGPNPVNEGSEMASSVIPPVMDKTSVTGGS